MGRGGGGGEGSTLSWSEGESRISFFERNPHRDANCAAQVAHTETLKHNMCRALRELLGSPCGTCHSANAKTFAPCLVVQLHWLIRLRVFFFFCDMACASHPSLTGLTERTLLLVRTSIVSTAASRPHARPNLDIACGEPTNPCEVPNNLSVAADVPARATSQHRLARATTPNSE